MTHGPGNRSERIIARARRQGPRDLGLRVLCREVWIQESTAGRVRAAGFALLATEARPHFDIVLPDLDDQALDRLRSCFGALRPNPGRS